MANDASRQGKTPIDPRLDLSGEADLRSAPGHDGVVGESETDPDRRDLRSDIGKYVSLASFPTTAQELISIASANGARDGVLSQLRALDTDESFETTRDLWYALGLETKERF